MRIATTERMKNEELRKILSDKVTKYYDKIGRKPPKPKKGPHIFTIEEKEIIRKRQTGSNNTMAVLDEQKVLEIKQKYASGKYLKKQLAEEYGVSKTCIVHITIGDRWSHIVCPELDLFLLEKNK